jgi:hypothetical protein
MTSDPISRYLDHARRFGVDGVLEAAAGELGDRELQRLRGLLLKSEANVPNRPRDPNGHGAKVGPNRLSGTAGPTDTESVTSARICAVCGRGLGGRHWHAKTCSPRCRKALQRRGGE